MALTDRQIEKVSKSAAELQEKIYDQAQTCGNCMPWEGGEVVWLTRPWPLSDTVRAVLEDWNGLEKTAFSDAEVQEVVGALELECPGCHSAWDAQTEVSEPPEPLGLDFLSGTTPDVSGKRAKIIVAFGDIVGFSDWTTLPLLTPERFKELMSKVYGEFVSFKGRTPYFTKALGDGIMFVQELNTPDDGARVESFMQDALELLRTMRPILSGGPSPRPGGFRIRAAVGIAWRLEAGDLADPAKKQIDYLGYPLNLAARLLAIEPDIELICHEGAKELIEHSVNLGPALSKVSTTTPAPKGVHPSDLAKLWKLRV
jgi:class 3 adenylate cyclase